MVGEELIVGKKLKKYFPVKTGLTSRSNIYVKAVNDVDIVIKKGEVVGLVGETGCGKSTLGRLLIRLIEPTDGELYFNPPPHILEKIRNNQPLTDEEIKEYSLFHMNKKKLREMRKRFSIVFQDPYSSLDPRMLIKDIVAEPLFSFGWNKKDAYSRVQELLEKVGLPQEFMYRFPHELSGGQRQRVAIARALALNPEFIVLDEPTSALDVSVQAQVLNLLEDLRKEFNLTMLFITHHILVVKHISDRIMVMYLGKIVESAKKEDIFKEPKHPYTQALLSSVPIPDPRVKVNRIILEGDVPSPINPPKGCFFHPRCKHAFEPCGFTTYEVVEPLRFVLDNKRNPELGNLEINEINIIDDLNMEITFNNPVDRGTVESIIQKEKEETRALFGIKEISIEGNVMKIKMHNPVEPKLKDIGNEHLVACHLVNPP